MTKSRPLWSKILFVIVIGFVMFCSGVLAFADDLLWYKQSDTSAYYIYERSPGNTVYASVGFSNVNHSGYRIAVCRFINKDNGTEGFCYLPYDIESGTIVQNPSDVLWQIVVKSGNESNSSVTSYFYGSNYYVNSKPIYDFTFNDYNVFVVDFRSLGSINYSSLFGKSVKNFPTVNLSKDIPTAEDYPYPKTTWTSDVFSLIPSSIMYTDSHTFYMDFYLSPDSVRYSDVTHYNVETWVEYEGKKLFGSTYSLSDFQYITHSGFGGTLGQGGVNHTSTYAYRFDKDLSYYLPFVNSMDNTINLFFRLTFDTGNTVLSSGYVSFTLDLTTGVVGTVKYYPTQFPEPKPTNPEDPEPPQIEVEPEIIQPKPTQPIYNIDWDNSNLDDYIRNNFGLKSYILALKDNLSFLPSWIWDLQFYSMGAISSIGIIKFLRG